MAQLKVDETFSLTPQSIDAILQLSLLHCSPGIVATLPAMCLQTCITAKGNWNREVNPIKRQRLVEDDGRGLICTFQVFLFRPATTEIKETKGKNTAGVGKGVERREKKTTGRGMEFECTWDMF